MVNEARLGSLAENPALGRVLGPACGQVSHHSCTKCPIQYVTVSNKSTYYKQEPRTNTKTFMEQGSPQAFKTQHKTIIESSSRISKYNNMLQSHAVLHCSSQLKCLIVGTDRVEILGNGIVRSPTM